jgi:hypothetical protein
MYKRVSKRRAVCEQRATRKEGEVQMVWAGVKKA